MNRREFINSSGIICAAAALGIFSGCASFPVIEAEQQGNTTEIDLLSFTKNKSQLIKVNGFNYKIFVREIEQNKYEALLMRCTHSFNQITYSGEEFICNAHGSRFSKSGKVLQGPAEKPLEALKTKVVDKKLTIYLS